MVLMLLKRNSEIAGVGGGAADWLTGNLKSRARRPVGELENCF